MLLVMRLRAPVRVLAMNFKAEDSVLPSITITSALPVQHPAVASETLCCWQWRYAARGLRDPITKWHLFPHVRSWMSGPNPWKASHLLITWKTTRAQKKKKNCVVFMRKQTWFDSVLFFFFSMAIADCLAAGVFSLVPEALYPVLGEASSRPNEPRSRYSQAFVETKLGIHSNSCRLFFCKAAT